MEAQLPIRAYYLTFFALMGLLALTAFASFFRLGAWGMPIALGIGAAKMLLILVYFMHLRIGDKTLRVVAGAAFLWLAILFTLALSDFLTRGVAGIAGK